MSDLGITGSPMITNVLTYSVDLFIYYNIMLTASYLISYNKLYIHVSYGDIANCVGISSVALHDLL